MLRVQWYEAVLTLLTVPVYSIVRLSFSLNSLRLLTVQLQWPAAGSWRRYHWKQESVIGAPDASFVRRHC